MQSQLGGEAKSLLALAHASLHARAPRMHPLFVAMPPLSAPLLWLQILSRFWELASIDEVGCCLVTPRPPRTRIMGSVLKG